MVKRKWKIIKWMFILPIIVWIFCILFWTWTHWGNTTRFLMLFGTVLCFIITFFFMDDYYKDERKLEIKVPFTIPFTKPFTRKILTFGKDPPPIETFIKPKKVWEKLSLDKYTDVTIPKAK